MQILEPLVRRPKALLSPGSFGFNGYEQFVWGGGARPDQPDRTFVGYINDIHQKNGVVAAAVETRALLLSGLRFEWARDGERFSNPATRRLNRPGSMTRPSFLKQLEYDASYHGSAYVVKDGAQLRRLRPDRVSVVLGSNIDPEWDGDAQARLPHDATVAGVVYHPTDGSISGSQFFGAGQFMAWMPEPDSIHMWRGTSWVTSVIREIVTDGQATETQQNFFEQGTVPGLIYIMDPEQTPDQVREFAQINEAIHAGTGNSFKNHYLGGGSDVKVVGSTLESLNLKDITGGIENRVAIRSRIPAVILGAREGLSGSSLNAGNYNSARRLVADGWFTPTAESLCASLEALTNVPLDAELTFDPSAVLFLQEDQLDAAEIQAKKASTLRTLVDGGFDPDSAAALVGFDIEHTGKLSVQLQEPGQDMTPDTGDDTE